MVREINSCMKQLMRKYDCTESHWKHSRPLREVSLVRDPSLIVGAHCVVDVWTPGHVGEHFEQVLHLLW